MSKPDSVPESQAALDTIRHLGSEISLLGHSLALLSWDQEVFMPPAAIEERSRQQALLSTLIHERVSGPTMAAALAALGATDQTPLGAGNLDLSWQDRRLVRLAWRSWKRASCLSAAHVAELSRVTSLSQDQWIRSRRDNDFASFRPWLEQLVALKQTEAALIDPRRPAYDVLLDEFEPDMSGEAVQQVFDRLQAGLVPLLQAVLAAGKDRPDPLAGRTWPVAAQQALGRQLIADLGYGSDCGRMDVSAHPFTTTLGRKDVRITSRYSEDTPFPGLSGLIHETGHALYELGFDDSLPDLLANAASLGIHESQSRLWENLVGRSLPFWEHYGPRLQELFPEAMAGLTARDFWRGANHVALSHIRVDADELSYSLHVILRFNLERRLFSGNLAVADLPQAWRDESRRLLGIEPPDDRQGVLQDIHWSMGSFGYFPTYALGNLYGAMFWQQVRADLPELDAQLRRGEFAPLRDWLRTHIHAPGATMTPAELLQAVCGRDLDHQPFLDYLSAKYRALYGLQA